MSGVIRQVALRGEKKPIPEDLKDEKYFERRKRNNLAAKKSRDQRKVCKWCLVKVDLEGL